MAAAHPVAEIGINDDWSYVTSAYKLADTGHLTYNGWATAMLGWQLYVGAALVRAFGHSFTVARLGTLVVAALTVYLFHRTFARAGLRGDFAVFGAAAISLTPIYMSLSGTFLSDIYGCFAITLCLYGCIRALTGASNRSRIQWILFAAATNVVCGSARQIAWFGVIFLVPGTLFALRAHRAVLKIGIAAWVAASLCIIGLIRWFNSQPYSIHEEVFPRNFRPLYAAAHLFSFFSDIPFMLLPLSVCFAVVLLRRYPRVAMYASVAALVYTVLAAIVHNPIVRLEPTMNDMEVLLGLAEGTVLLSSPQPILADWIRCIVTVISIDGLIAFAYLTWVYVRRRHASDVRPPESLLKKDLLWMTLPYLACYVVMLVPRASSTLFHRYALGLSPVLVLLGLSIIQRLYQRKIPALAWVAVVATMLWGIGAVHDQFSFSRARVSLMKAYLDTGGRRSEISGGWEDDSMFELTQAPAVNESRIVNPPGYYKPGPPHTMCVMLDLGCDLVPGNMAPHIHAIYGVAYYPVPGVVEAPVAHETYSRWLTRTPGVLYVIRLPHDAGADTK